MKFSAYCDKATFGDDETLIQVQRGGETIRTERISHLSPVQIAERMMTLDNELAPEGTPMVDINVVVKTHGIGRAVADELARLGYKVTE